ncbi:hypothetical protein JDW15_06325 [Aerococcaceae bacterium zg-ZJ1578]|uniref:hypothetical protein n=1 Tax=Aerococcaceae bacterium zg-252 TaxID=2796928 RepID=UPI001A34E464|nr:hypothetical protein [Aerococcaceae bacterium zg-1578]
MISLIKLRVQLIKAQFNITKWWEKVLVVLVLLSIFVFFKGLTFTTNKVFLLHGLYAGLISAFGLFDTANRKISTSEVKMYVFFPNFDKLTIRNYFKYKRMCTNLIIFILIFFTIRVEHFASSVFYLLMLSLAMLACSISYRFLPKGLADMNVVLVRVGYWILFSRVYEPLETFVSATNSLVLLVFLLISIGLNFLLLPEPQLIEVKHAPITL